MNEKETLREEILSSSIIYNYECISLQAKSLIYMREEKNKNGLT